MKNRSRRVLRINLSTNKVVARIHVGDGPADMVFAGSHGWVVTHRDNTLFGVDLNTNGVTRLRRVGGGDAAVERLALLEGGLWATGRGVPLIEFDPATGSTPPVRRYRGDGASTSSRRSARSGFPYAFPKVRLVRGVGYVEHVATAGGLTSGIDLALRVVERYLGATAAGVTAEHMEYERHSRSAS